MTCGIDAFTDMANRHKPLERCGLRSIRKISQSWTLPSWDWGMLGAVAGPSIGSHLAPFRSALAENAGLRWKALSCTVQTVAPNSYLESPATSQNASMPR